MARPSDRLRVLEDDPTFDVLSLDEVSEMISKLRGKRHSRIWFDPDVRLLDALNTAEEALEKVASYLVVEGLELPAR